MDEFQDSLEKFNTGAGYYIRVNELLREEAAAIINIDKVKRYHVLYCLYLDLLPKCNEAEKTKMKEAFKEIITELSKAGNKAQNLPDDMLTQWSSYMRGLLELKGMLTPKNKDPRRATIGGFN